MNRMVLAITAAALSMFAASTASAQQRVVVNTAAQCQAIRGTLRVENGTTLVCIVGASAPARIEPVAPRTDDAPASFARLVFVPTSRGNQVFFSGERVYREGGADAYLRALEASRNLCLTDGYRPGRQVAGRDYPAIGYRDRRRGSDGFDIRADDLLRMGTARSRETQAEARAMVRDFCRDFEPWDRRQSR
jgi:hypothetical protein